MMKRVVGWVSLVCLVAVFAGCGLRGPAGGRRARALAEWLAGQEYSSWETFRRDGAEPERPESPDGLTLGSPNVFAAIGSDPDDLTSLDVFWADRRTVRPFARPVTVSLSVRGPGIRGEAARDPVPLRAVAEQRLRRVRNTSIAVSESEWGGLRVTCVDFAPMSPDHNFLARWFMVENTGSRARDVRLLFEAMASGDRTSLGGGALQLGDKAALVSDARVRNRRSGRGDDRPREYAEIALGRVRPGERGAAAALLVGVSDPAALPAQVAAARAALPRLTDLLKETEADWRAWSSAVPLHTGDRRMDDLLDSLLCLLRSHVGPDAIHTGSLRYPHDRAWIRDSYWVQRALLELGRRREAVLNLEFFHRAWRAYGIASYYEIPSLRSTAYGYHGVELPHYLVLMVRDAEQMAGVDGAAYWDMVQGCLDEAEVAGDGLQPMNGDETWLLAASVRELDALLDNSWLLVASAEYGAELAARAGDAERAARYQALAAGGRAGLERFRARDGGAEWLAAGVGADGSQDLSLCPEVLARGSILGVLPSSQPELADGLREAWQRLGYERGIRTHSRSATVSGGTPGYVLWAAAEHPGAGFAPELARRTMQFASATGCVWEFHDLHDPAWGGEKRRLWDSAVVLAGLVHTLFEVETSGDGVRLTPRQRPVAEPDGQEGRLVEASAPAEDLITGSGPALVLESGSPQHAGRIARELLRHLNRTFAVAAYAGQPPADASAIIVSRGAPPAGWERTAWGYWARQWDGPPQLWVQNRGHVFRDTDGLLTDLLSRLQPERDQPLAFPDANLDLAGRFGEQPAGRAELSAVSLFRRGAGAIDLSGGRTTVTAGGAEFTVSTAPEGGRRLKLSVAAAPRPAPAELSVTLPAGWWLVHARDMTGRWDRVGDPVGEFRLADGRLRLVYAVRPGETPLHFTFTLARLPVGGP